MKIAVTILREFSGAWMTAKYVHNDAEQQIDWRGIDAHTAMLSGGEKHLLAIARALDEGWERIDQHGHELVRRAVAS